ncbi:MAG: Pyrimidine-specific ribonucleoside hydrolase RihA [Chlamydiae bacterium]|nr:Pyrimidine-specific ribonucleoside hydrolase RihA [Chlamydiota bacterium]
MRLKILLLVLFSFFTIHLSADNQPIKVIVDTDCDMDDMMAILYLLKLQNVEILAVTTTGSGMAHWKCTAPNILDLLELAGHPNIPVSYGAQESLSPYANFPEVWRTGVDNVFNIPLPKNPNPPSSLSSCELIIQTLKNSTEKVTILSLAPMTNIALAIESDPSIISKIENIVISGGAVNFSGNIVGEPRGFKNICAEYNIFLDVKAAEVSISSGAPITLVPLNATQDAPINQAIYDKFKNEQRNPSANFVYEVIAPFVETQKNVTLYFWDPVAAMVMTTPSIGEYKNMNLSLNTQQGQSYGCFFESSSGSLVNVCLSINPTTFYSLFYKTLSQGH